jgi:NAD-dependent deacetylase
MQRIVILTGAGISAESGIGTFRDRHTPGAGLWARVDWRDVATPEGYARDRGRVLEFYNARRAKVRDAAPNDAHHALARLERDWPGEVLLVTQNVDPLHERAGSRNLLHMHGAHASALCAACGHRWPAPEQIGADDPCPACAAAMCRPDVVWFGEMPYHLDAIAAALDAADLFAAIGTSGVVYPAGGFVKRARASGAHCVELNLEATARSPYFHEHRTGPATEVVPGWVEDLLSAGRDAMRPGFQ